MSSTTTSTVNHSQTGRICGRCIMDESDPDIQFDSAGHCNHCTRYDARVAALPPDSDALPALIKRIQRAGKKRPYDCVIGVSGGVDSTYVAYIVKEELGLRPLAVHLDNGWNSELAVSNIEQVLKTLDIDLYTYVIDWEEFRDLQLSFLKASTPDGEIPTDHAIVALLKSVAAQHRIRYILSGENVRTEGILPNAWARGHSDWRYIRHVHKRFGSRPLKSFPRFGIGSLLTYSLIKRQRHIHILDHVPFNRRDAIDILESKLGWRSYGAKHHESIYTRFFQGVILPTKFHIDKRRAHLSALICGGQTDRETALVEMTTPPCPPQQADEDREYVTKKLGITSGEFDAIMTAPPKTYWDYPSSYTNPFTKLGIRVALRLPTFLERMGYT